MSSPDSALVGPSDSLAEALADRYRLVQEVGRGGWGVVYKAEDLKHHRQVAIKALRLDSAGEEAHARFLREIEIAAVLSHPHILPLFDSGEASGQLFYVMPFVEGESLQQRIRREGPLEIDEALRIASEVADALQHAHAHGIIHRDVKPSNILFLGHHAVVADFGVARALSAATPGVDITTKGTFVGTPAYMSPEQCVPEGPVDGRADVYSLGCVLYEMLCGAPPFSGPTVQAIVAQHLSLPVPPLRNTRPSIPGQVEAIVTRALAKLPEERYPSAEALLRSLSPLMISGERPLPAEGRRRVRALTSLRVISLAFLGLVGIWLVRRNWPRPTAADPTLYALLPFERSGVVPPALNESQRLRDAFHDWSGVSLADPVRVDEAVREVGGAPFVGASAQSAAKALGVGRYVRGTVSGEGDAMRVRAFLYETGNSLLLGESTVLVPPTLAGADSAFARLVDVLLFGNSPANGFMTASNSTRSVPARLSFLRGRDAVANWDLAQAESLFAAASTIDAAFSEAWLWLALSRLWSNQPADRWNIAARQAAAGRRRLSGRDAGISSALEAMVNEDYPLACQTLAGLTLRDSTDFVVWYASAQCQDADHAVVRDSRSVSGWRFRSSFENALRHYLRAFQLLPSIHKGLRDDAFAETRRLLKTSGTNVRQGRALRPDTGTFHAFPSLDSDTLVFVPFRAAALISADPATLRRIPRTVTAATRRQRRLFQKVATGWAAAFPNSSAAMEALGVVLQLIGEPSGLDTLVRARALAKDTLSRVRVGASEVWVRTKFSLPDDLLGLVRARELADSLLSEGKLLNRDLETLAGLASLTGRVKDALAFRARVGQSRGGELSPAVAKAQQLLETYAAFGEPVDSLKALEQHLDFLIMQMPEGERDALRIGVFARAAGLALPSYAFRSIANAARSGDYLMDAAARMAAGDSAGVRLRMRRIEEGRRFLGPDDVTYDALLPEAWLLWQAGDPRAAAQRIDPTLAALRYSTTGIGDPVYAAPLVRTMALRAELAAALGDRATARRWAAAVAELWSNADDVLQPLVERMRSLAR